MASLLEVARQPAMPLNGIFSGHETFPFRYAWLKKGIDGLLHQPDIFNRDDAMVTFGVGKNMVQVIIALVASEQSKMSNYHRSE